MPLIMVSDGERKTKKLLAASTCEQVIQKAKLKLGLPAESEYKVFVESKGETEGSLIDDDDLFNELTSFYLKSNKHLEVIILPFHEEWRPSEDHGERLNRPDRSTSESSDSSGHSITPASVLQVELHVPLTPASTPSRTYPAIAVGPFIDIFEPVLDALKQDPPPKKLNQMKRSALREAQKLVTSHISKKVKDYQRSVCVRYGEAVFLSHDGKFKPVFKREVNGVFCSDGLADFISHIYNAAVNYGKGSENTAKRGQRRLRVQEREENLDDPDASPLLEPRSINYNPPLPTNESAESQEQKRESLLQATDLSSAYAVCLLQQTYPTQRSDIISCRSVDELKFVFTRWPSLKTPVLLLHHASLLFKKDVSLVWGEQLDKRSLEIVNYFTAMCSSARLRQESTPSRKNLVSKLQTILSDAKQASEQFHSQLPNTISVFLLVLAYMRENANFFFQLVQTDTLDVVGAADPSNRNPILIVKGHSIFDCTAKFFVVLLEVAIEVENCLEGILIMFLSYCIFGFKYNEGIQNTLEFIQRFLLQINPAPVSAGDKRAKKRRNTGDVAGRVFKLSEDIREFSSPWSIPA